MQFIVQKKNTDVYPLIDKDYICFERYKTRLYFQPSSRLRMHCAKSKIVKTSAKCF